MTDFRRIDNMMNRDGKSCSNCRFGSGAPGDDIITCEIHIENFTAVSFCSNWTERDIKTSHPESNGNSQE